MNSAWNLHEICMKSVWILFRYSLFVETDEFCVKHDEYVIRNDGFLNKNDEFCIKWWMFLGMRAKYSQLSQVSSCKTRNLYWKTTGFLHWHDEFGIKNLYWKSRVLCYEWSTLHLKWWRVDSNWPIFNGIIGRFVKLTPFTIRMLVIHRYFDIRYLKWWIVHPKWWICIQMMTPGIISNARKQLGYNPIVSTHRSTHW